jgi:hypothetical protein
MAQANKAEFSQYQWQKITKRLNAEGIKQTAPPAILLACPARIIILPTHPAEQWGISSSVAWGVAPLVSLNECRWSDKGMAFHPKCGSVSIFAAPENVCSFC